MIIAGLVDKYVMSAYTPSVEKEKSFPKEKKNANSCQHKEKKKISFECSSSHEEDSIYELNQRLNQLCMADLEVY